MPASDQSDVAFLQAGGLGAIPERIDTHAAIVLLTPDRAYKLKRPVRYSFLDFTTLKRREQTCATSSSSTARTLRSFTCASFLPPTRRPRPGRQRPTGRMAAGNAALPAEAELDRVAAATGLPDLVDRLAETVATSHAAASPAPARAATPPCAGRPRQPHRPRRRRPRVFTTDAVRELDALTQTLWPPRPAPRPSPRRRSRPPLSRRPPPRQHRAPRRPPGPVRLHRVRR